MDRVEMHIRDACTSASSFGLETFGPTAKPANGHMALHRVQTWTSPSARSATSAGDPVAHPEALSFLANAATVSWPSNTSDSERCIASVTHDAPADDIREALMHGALPSPSGFSSASPDPPCSPLVDATPRGSEAAASAEPCKLLALAQHIQDACAIPNATPRAEQEPPDQFLLTVALPRPFGFCPPPPGAVPFPPLFPAHSGRPSVLSPPSGSPSASVQPPAPFPGRVSDSLPAAWHAIPPPFLPPPSSANPPASVPAPSPAPAARPGPTPPALGPEPLLPAGVDGPGAPAPPTSWAPAVEQPEPLRARRRPRKGKEAPEWAQAAGRGARKKEQPAADPEAPPQQKTCTCSKTQCLKLYCECFAAGGMCGPQCRCKGCFNDGAPEHAAQRQYAVDSALQRNPLAFASKVVGSAARHTTGCRCRKSGCEKKYCECYNAGVQCTEACRCRDCCNGGPHAPQAPPPEAGAAFAAPPAAVQRCTSKARELRGGAKGAGPAAARQTSAASALLGAISFIAKREGIPLSPGVQHKLEEPGVEDVEDDPASNPGSPVPSHHEIISDYSDE